MCAIWLPRVLVRKHKLLQAAALAPVVETGECEDVGALLSASTEYLWLRTCLGASYLPISGCIRL